MIHLLPSSRSTFGVFFCMDDCGFDLRGGGTFLSGTTLLDRRSGFLWVIWDESTFFRPDVTDPPLLSAARRAVGPFAVGAPEWGGAEVAGGPAGAEDEGPADAVNIVGAAGPCTAQQRREKQSAPLGSS